jgi:hypothetical protein
MLSPVNCPKVALNSSRSCATIDARLSRVDVCLFRSALPASEVAEEIADVRSEVMLLRAGEIVAAVACPLAIVALIVPV